MDDAPPVEKNSPFKLSLMITAVFALVSLPFTKSVFEKTIPALQNNRYIYLAFASLVMYVGTLLIIQSNQKQP